MRSLIDQPHLSDYDDERSGISPIKSMHTEHTTSAHAPHGQNLTKQRGAEGGSEARNLGSATIISYL